MASAREIRRRIKSVTNIRQITMALEAVSASKVRRATAQALAARAYANLAMQVLVNVALSNRSSTPLHPLLTMREKVGNITILMITSDRGSAGAYNANVIRVARQFSQHLGRPTRWIAVGRKGRDILFRAKEHIIAEFTGLPPWWTIEDVRPIARTAIDEFLNGNADEVYVAYTDFINTLTQSPRIQRLLPLTHDEADKMMAVDYVKVRERPTAMASDYIFEPGAGEILDSVVPRFVETIIYELILESNASEHSARMVAMRNASENAKALADDLQLSYNKARQAAITGEILDIVGGVEALKGR
jgi:F-type H+-transporting ATPase subunit gamma